MSPDTLNQTNSWFTEESFSIHSVPVMQRSCCGPETCVFRSVCVCMHAYLVLISCFIYCQMVVPRDGLILCTSKTI